MACSAGGLEDEDGGFQRFSIPISYLYHPLFQNLLDKAREVYGYNTSGPLMLPCSVEDLLHLRWRIEKEQPVTAAATTTDISFRLLLLSRSILVNNRTSTYPLITKDMEGKEAVSIYYSDVPLNFLSLCCVVRGYSLLFFLVEINVRITGYNSVLVSVPGSINFNLFQHFAGHC
ncbi:auxin-induced protein 10a5 [Phtheirospermum japonicum]|uniref:Auxin-induced protein 10a5 n=1 Tax=Phtheirospermum japonicum TaxID=374723 RepID=A0A830BN86_9LAMI|nr:auxin-induced protein 10a5 [Phtheirospermum japonicum]